MIRLATPFVLIAAFASVLYGQTPSPATHWRETDTETLWTGRYSNCDYGYYVALPGGAVGHATKSPGSNHGFAINLAAPQSTEPFDTSHANRFIDVYNFYDVEDHDESTAATLNYYLGVGEISDTEKVQVLSSSAYSLTGLSARRLTVRWNEGSVPIRQDRILAYRRAGGILYQLTLQSPEKTFAADEQLFNRMVEGFHITKLSNGECSND